MIMSAHIIFLLKANIARATGRITAGEMQKCFMTEYDKIWHDNKLYSTYTSTKTMQYKKIQYSI